MTDASSTAQSVLQLLGATRVAATAAERRFVLLNRSRDTWPYQIAVLWSAGRVAGHSGVGQVEAQGPYAQWLDRLVPALLKDRPPGLIEPATLPPELAREWAEWWPAHALWCRSGTTADDAVLLLARDLPWQDDEAVELQRWFSLWRALDDRHPGQAAPRRFIDWRALPQLWRAAPGAGRRRVWMLAALLAVACLPVRLTVRAPGELVPRDPVVLRAAVEGTVRALQVEPNQRVQAGQVLAELDDAGWASRLDVARQALLTAEAEWRQTSQQALNDPKAKAQLAAAQGKYEERRAELAYASEQARRTTLRAPHDGVVLIQDPGSWPGRTVSAGEAVMKLARPEDQEIEAWLAAGDAIDLPDGAPLRLHLDSRPARPLSGTLRLYAYEAEHRPDAGLGYRLRGRLDEAAGTERLGARGTVRIDGPWVPLVYWVLRRPLAALREATGW